MRGKTREKIPEFTVRPGVTRRQLLSAGFTEASDHWTYQQALYEDFIYVKIMISKEDNFCVTNIFRGDSIGGSYAPFYNLKYGPRNLVAEKVTERYLRLLRRLNRADVIEFVAKKS